MLSNVTPCSLHRLISQHQIVSLSIVTGGRISQQQVVCPTATGDSVSLTGHGLRLVLNIHALLAVIALSADRHSLDVMANSKKKQEEEHLKLLREMVALPHNKQCFDCHQRGPTYLNMTIGSFICTSCSGLL